MHDIIEVSDSIGYPTSNQSLWQSGSQLAVKYIPAEFKSRKGLTGTWLAAAALLHQEIDESMINN
jgi:hypothetical protein